MGVLSRRSGGTNGKAVRRAVQPAGESALREFGCDVAYISDESQTAEEIVEEEIARLGESPDVRRVCSEIFDRLRVMYELGDLVRHSAQLRMIVERVVGERIELSGEESAGCAGATPCGVAGSREAGGARSPRIESLNAFASRLNDAIFRQQALTWLADMDFKIHLHGAGWDKHPTLAKFARGPVDSDTMADEIARASKINLQLSASGGVTPRLMRGIEAGGFFLFRYSAGDVIEKIYETIWGFCGERMIGCDAELRREASGGIRRLLDFASHTLGGDVFELHPDGFVADLKRRAQTGFNGSAIANFPGEYPAVTFSTRDEMIGMVSRYLYDAPERRRIADAMRRRVLEGPVVRVSVSRRVIRVSPTPISGTSAKRQAAGTPGGEVAA